MILTYEGKKTEKEIIDKIKNCKLKSIKGNPKSQSKLIKGENLEVLKYLLNEAGLKGKIDLIYIDPPFSTNNIFRMSKEKANSISRSNGDNVAYDDSLIGPEFLEFIRERLILLRELLSDKGSIYFHIDYKIGHYIKVLMDEVFGKNNFLNDLTRIKCNPKNFERKAFGNIKDMILFYSKTGNHIWNEPKAEMNERDIERLFKKTDKNGRKYTTIPLHAPGETTNGATGQPWRGMMPPKGRHWRSPPKVLEELDKQGLIEWSKNGVPRKKIYADEKEGKKIQDILEFKDLQNPTYPTEKNLELLRLIVSASSNRESIVLDCFCGSGTTLKAAQELGRNWIGIDKSEEAINVALNKLTQKQKTLFGNNNYFEYLEQEC
ncbi:MAG: site-specific DNA-methyltransferase [Thermoplasmatales archaeon]|nr:site-specific DNA-methyltransferase [Thermoplasmatales archaeon]